jgi:hypothetical protein
VNKTFKAMRTTRRNATRQFSPDNTLNTSPVIEEQVARSEENLAEEIPVEDIYTPGSLSKNKRSKKPSTEIESTTDEFEDESIDNNNAPDHIDERT